MTLAADAGDDEQITAIDYVPGVRGHAVITVGPDGDGAEALAVWRLGPTGVAVGAWILNLDAARNDPAALHGIMTMLRGRCLVGWSADDSVKSLHRVAGLVAPTMIDRLSDGVVTIPDLLAEIAECRKRYLETGAIPLDHEVEDRSADLGTRCTARRSGGAACAHSSSCLDGVARRCTGRGARGGAAPGDRVVARHRGFALPA
jgi:hypothetical protein